MHYDAITLPANILATGQNYFDLFAPITSYKSILALKYLVASHLW